MFINGLFFLLFTEINTRLLDIDKGDNLIRSLAEEGDAGKARALITGDPDRTLVNGDFVGFIELGLLCIRRGCLIVWNKRVLDLIAIIG